ncbi:unnamed protein product [Protopolystoma xenopodis]|uniref:Uncharacterized protein n=1 Tax=Protopolystoma xenopodis TaxID=117903 RepID=A0A448XSC1_9PLAT|nr:unnamed protein product [Protopolystoma xenopodis]
MDIQRFHTLLRSHHERGSPRTLLCLLLSKSSTCVNSSRDGLPPERTFCPLSLLAELNMPRVELNPVAPRILFRAISRVAGLASRQV